MYYMQATSYCNWMVNHVQKVNNSENNVYLFIHQYSGKMDYYIASLFLNVSHDCLLRTYK